VNEDMFLVVGLGNPGSQYAATRHNVGFMVVDDLAERFGVSVDREKWQAHSVQMVLWGRPVCLLKPNTFMNLSGRAVARYVDFYKVRPAQIVVVHDDLDMAPGRVKLVVGGGAGGHNGIRSLVECLGTKDFLRLKVGIGRPGKMGLYTRMPVEKYVLAPFAPDEQILLEQRMELIEKGLEYLVCDGTAKAMNLLNTIKP